MERRQNHTLDMVSEGVGTHDLPTSFVICPPPPKLPTLPFFRVPEGFSSAMSHLVLKRLCLLDELSIFARFEHTQELDGEPALESRTLHGDRQQLAQRRFRYRFLEGITE